MSKRAKEAALKAYPEKLEWDYRDMDYDQNMESRIAYQQGYEQAEKEILDLAQLWVDSGDANVMSFQKFLKCYETQGNK